MKRVVWFLVGMWCVWFPTVVALFVVPDGWAATVLFFACVFTIWLTSMCIPVARHECAGTGPSQPVPAPPTVHPEGDQ